MLKNGKIVKCERPEVRKARKDRKKRRYCVKKLIQRGNFHFY